jgi:hypothetical protein
MAQLIMCGCRFHGSDAVVALEANLGLRDVFVEVVIVDMPIFECRDGTLDDRLSDC